MALPQKSVRLRLLAVVLASIGGWIAGAGPDRFGASAQPPIPDAFAIPPDAGADTFDLQQPIRPGDAGRKQRNNGQKRTEAADQAVAADARIAKLFGEVSQIDELPTDRRSQAQSPAADAVFAAEATGRKTADIGDLLKRSKSAHGVSIQHRTPIVSDTRVRGQRVGQVLASGSYWAPARMDLDTMMNKIDSRLIEDTILIKGPYAARYGPGFRFVDLEFIHTPRYDGGPEIHGMTSATYNTNGEQWYGRQSIWGGSDRYGYHISYGHQTGNDYETGAGFTIPTSYKSRDLFVAMGHDLSDSESIEFNLLRLDQTDVEFPGLVFDLNFLVTDGYEITYTDTNPYIGERFTAEVWYNRTRFEGDTLRPGKNDQIPTLVFDLESPSGFDGYAVTDGDALSGGYRLENTFGWQNWCGQEGQWAIGTDMILLNQELNDIEPLAPPDDNNFPIPRSHSVDIGFYVEDVEKVSHQLTMTAGARIDAVFTDSRDIVDGVPATMSDLKDSELDQQFLLGSAYLTAEYELIDGWAVEAGLGTAHRPPTLTEMYADNSFIGSLQRGLTFLEGDPQLSSEKLYQIDLGTHYTDEQFRLGLFGHHAWIHDYITYDLVSPAGAIDGFPQGAALVNTDLATLAGFETYGQYDANRMVSLFGILSFVEGRDHSRNKPARQYSGTFRSDVDKDEEPLPGIAPLEARLGILLQDPSPERRWGIEFLTRIVDNQDRIADSLEEIETPGFTVYNLRTYARFNQWLVTAGVENLSDKFYREHIDYRSGLGVFRPGIGFYAGAQVNY
ncbi:TonB-dependent receptor [Crateriforma conspicua]|uniref:TonB dependent receptor n=1 Tax=Crateriforma conspicua TaxID=2527996 RepID=A0A5C5Y809_9PLAN|nr:TonB-dependent receptor [Crateriforma conspicua]QDV65719.1 TonB dependent receptor [Crateriforma conspicua]TWT71119.1 TonB dependent receptor [Crateriforma conspicua]